ncbi:MAG: hypothetical protein O9275_18370, partial [Microcystis sp. LE19-196.1B]|nr:hypothetical protein [Microcystis sp. LE19-196.1B]
MSDYSFDGVSFKLLDQSEKVSQFDHVIDCKGLFGSSGWIDLRSGLGEPGQEYRETIASLCESLLVSGFSKAVVMPNTDPVVQSKNEAEFILNRSKSFLPELVIMGAVTKKTEGEDLTEMLDMHFQAGLNVF